MLYEIPPIERLIFALTTHCNLTCHECVAGIPLISHPEHYHEDYIHHAASFFSGIERITISGGEPTIHPRFRQIIPKFKKMFGCRALTLVTNACKAVECTDVLHHFDDIVVSHYQNNYREVKYITENFKDSHDPGLTLHVCTARRARSPIPCSRAYQIKYMYGRIYPCCAIPNGLEHIGIPLTQQWRDEIGKIPLPCDFCCFAEEEFPEADFDFADIATLSKRVYNQGRQESIWPNFRPDIEVYGLELDSWMRDKIFIKCRPDHTKRYIVIKLESLSPISLHPITLTFQDDSYKTVYSYVIKEPGPSEVCLNLSQLLWKRDSFILKLTCNPTFIPSQITPESSDSRALGVRILSLYYQ